MTDEERKPVSRTEKISYAEKGRFFKIRNIINIVFILLTIAGMATYLLWSEAIGGPMLIVAIALKMIECVLRYMH